MPPGRHTAPEVCFNAMGVNHTLGLQIGRPHVQGHRGAGYAAPPNSMEAMITAAQHGLDSVEFDVWQLKCGALIVAHGPEYLEAGDIGLRKFTLEELREDGEECSLFSEVVKFCLKTDMRMNIDVKGDDANVVDEILAQLEYLDATRLASLSSFEHTILERARALNSNLRIGVLHEPYSIYSARPKFIPSKKQPLRKDFATYLARPGDSINLAVEVITPEIVRECHKKRVRVMAWFATVPQVDDGAENLIQYERLLRAGVDVICTNRPKFLQEYLDARFYNGYATTTASSSRATSATDSPCSSSPEKASFATSVTTDGASNYSY